MDIHRINSVLAKAIVGLQEAEVRVMAEAMAVGVTSYRVPSPAELGKAQRQPEVDSDYAAAHAVTNPAGWTKLFDSLKPGQTLWVNYRSPMESSGGRYVPFRVGRKVNSKKYKYSAVTLLAPGQKKTMGPGWQPRLYKRGGGPIFKEGEVDFTIGDLGTQLKGLYLQKTKASPKGKRPRGKKSGGTYEVLKNIVNTGTIAKVGGQFVDVWTASAIVKVADALNPANRKKFLSMDLSRMQDVAFKLLKDKGA
jgi:hypothetical protein